MRGRAAHRSARQRGALRGTAPRSAAQILFLPVWSELCAAVRSVAPRGKCGAVRGIALRCIASRRTASHCDDIWTKSLCYARRGVATRCVAQQCTAAGCDAPLRLVSFQIFQFSLLQIAPSSRSSRDAKHRCRPRNLPEKTVSRRLPR